jgi:hypothetical protein
MNFSGSWFLTRNFLQTFPAYINTNGSDFQYWSPFDLDFNIHVLDSALCPEALI